MGRIAHTTRIIVSPSVQLHPSIAVVCMVLAVLLPENALVVSADASCSVEYVTAATPSPVSTA